MAFITVLVRLAVVVVVVVWSSHTQNALSTVLSFVGLEGGGGCDIFLSCSQWLATLCLTTPFLAQCANGEKEGANKCYGVFSVIPLGKKTFS